MTINSKHFIKLYQGLKKQLATQVKIIHLTRKEFYMLLNHDYKKLQSTKLYKNWGGEYCSCLELLEKIIYKNIYFSVDILHM